MIMTIYDDFSQYSTAWLCAASPTSAGNGILSLFYITFCRLKNIKVNYIILYPLRLLRCCGYNSAKGVESANYFLYQTHIRPKGLYGY